MDGGAPTASRRIEELRLQMAVDRLVATGALSPEAALHAEGAFERLLAERGLLGCQLEGLRREARQQRRHARAQRLDAMRQCQAAIGQWVRAVCMRHALVESVERPATTPR
jgi:hypothetical protein